MKPLLLGESLECLIDHRGKTPLKLGSDFVDSGVPVASAVLVKNGSLMLDDARCVDRATYERWMRVPMKKGDVILTSEAPLGRVARVLSDRPLVLGQRLFGLRGRSDILDSGFLFYALQTDQVQSDLLGRSTGTTVFGIRQSALRQVVIPAPDIGEQRAIAEVLGSLDDKIAANDRLVDSAERLMIAMGATATSRVSLSRVSRQQSKSVKAQEFAAGVAHYSLPAFDQGAMPDNVPGESIKSNKFRIAEPCVLVSKLNPRIPRIWNVPSLPDAMCLASTEFVVLAPNGLDASVLWATLRQPDFSTELTGKVAGTSGSHQRVRPAELMSAQIADPLTLSPEVAELISTLGIACHVRRGENGDLTKTRDALLPLLMSGKVRVKDAAKIVQGVVR